MHFDERDFERQVVGWSGYARARHIPEYFIFYRKIKGNGKFMAHIELEKLIEAINKDAARRGAK